MKAQMTEQLRVITFVHGQKKALLHANEKLMTSISFGIEDLSSVFTRPVMSAYLDTLVVHNQQLDWEIENLQRDLDKLTEILEQVNSPILRVMPVPVPPGPRNIR